MLDLISPEPVLPPTLIALGGNVGDVAAAFIRAVDALQAQGVLVQALSSLYLTEPLLPANGAPQPPYLNAAILGNTALSPQQLVALCHGLPAQLGCAHDSAPSQWAPRALDVDVIALGQTTVSQPGCRLPHPGLPFRPFVLWPLHDIAPLHAFAPHGRTSGDFLRRLARPMAGLHQRALSWHTPRFVSLQGDTNSFALAVASALAS